MAEAHQCPGSLFVRAFCFDMDLRSLQLTATEKQTFLNEGVPRGELARGYLAWHRSMLMLTTPLLLVSSMLGGWDMIVTYADQEQWYANYFGSMWPTLQAAQNSLASVYWGSLACDLLTSIGCVMAAVLTSAALASWTSMKRASRRLGMALLLWTGTRFFVQLCFPVAMFVDTSAVQRDLCIAELEETIMRMPRMYNATFSLDVDRTIPALCEEVLYQLDSDGALNSSALINALASAGVLSPDAANMTLACDEQASANLDRARRRPSTLTGRSLQTFPRRPRPSRQDNDDTADGDEQMVYICMQLSTVTVRAASLSSASAASVATMLRVAQVSQVFVSILPTAAGLASGVARASLFAKHLLCHSRAPASYASTFAIAGLPPLVALLTLMSQALSSPFAVAGAVCYVLSLVVWAPLGLLPATLGAAGAADGLVEAAARHASTGALRVPLAGKLVRVTLSRAAYRSYGWLVCTILLVSLVLAQQLLWSNGRMQSRAVSALQAWWRSLDARAIVQLVNLPIRVTGGMYLALLTYIDSTLWYLCHQWSEDEADAAEVREQRTAELAEVLPLFARHEAVDDGDGARKATVHQRSAARPLSARHGSQRSLVDPRSMPSEIECGPIVESDRI